MSETQERLYRFAPGDRGGWILGLGGSQCIALAVTILAASTFLNAGAPAPLVLSPVLFGLTYTFARIGGIPAHELVPVVITVRVAAMRSASALTCSNSSAGALSRSTVCA
jgi:hypothetical protein